eukprot:TRINITY_DN4569_c0_g1_i2.p1 TRINITY_DN4569_c0_g1~~TRINITY_DN4569_c0_g1_i2.p1  ORF type:complete len:177 (-),score=23.29 TRINITY_DN4569_c0_g1_i2:24-554(-)
MHTSSDPPSDSILSSQRAFVARNVDHSAAPHTAPQPPSRSIDLSKWRSDQNGSGFQGVHQHCRGDRTKHLGIYDSAEQAAFPHASAQLEQHQLQGGCKSVGSGRTPFEPNCKVKTEEASDLRTERPQRISDSKQFNVPRISDSEQLNVPHAESTSCLLYTSPSPRDRTRSRMPSSA